MTILPPIGPAVDELTMTIGTREIYDKLVAVEIKLDALPTTDHETRIRAIERWRYGIGGSVLLSAVATGVSFYGQMVGRS